MNLSITSYPKEKYLLIVSKGKIESGEDLLLQSQMVIAEIGKHSAKKILVNEQRTELPMDLPSYFDLTKSYADLLDAKQRQVKLVVVISKKYKEVASSWETICHSLGLHFYIFTSLKEAKNYLLEEGEKDEWPLY